MKEKPTRQGAQWAFLLVGLVLSDDDETRRPIKGVGRPVTPLCRYLERFAPGLNLNLGF